VARLVAQWLSERLGQQFVIENRGGAGTPIGTDAVAHAALDGYTLLLAGPPAAINATLYGNLNYNFIRDLAPVAGIEGMPLIMAVRFHGKDYLSNERWGQRTLVRARVTLRRSARSGRTFQVSHAFSAVTGRDGAPWPGKKTNVRYVLFGRPSCPLSFSSDSNRAVL
jgi:Tripartite tricarboxylate transporter family receptor